MSLWHLALAIGLAACTPLEPADDLPGVSLEVTDAAVEGLLKNCPAPERRREERIGGPDGTTVTTHALWTCRTNYVIAGEVIVEQGATLEIWAGTRVVAEPGALLLVEAGGKLIAKGRADAPIVFTATGASGRGPAHWRGLVLLSADSNNLGPGARVPQTLPDGDGRGLFGDSKVGLGEYCGSLSYVRVEFAGGLSPADDLPLGGLTLAGCGGSTRLDHVQVHRSTEGIAIYGGDVDLRFVVASGSEHDGIEWTGGYTGSMQHVAVHQWPGSGAALRGSNRADDSSAEPRSNPTVINATLVRASEGIDTEDVSPGVEVEQGTGLLVTNSLMQGFGGYAVNVGGLQSDAEGGVSLRGSVFHGNGRNVGTTFPTAGPEAPGDFDDDGAFDEDDAFRHPACGNVFANPKLLSEGADRAPDLRPDSDVVETPGLEVPEGFEPTGYAGAFSRAAEGGRSWMAGWTAFPQD